MSSSPIDPMIHDPGRLPVVAALAVLPAGDALSITRLQGMARLASATLAIRLRELERAGYVRTGKTTVVLTRDGRVALDRYVAALRAGVAYEAPAPDMRAGDADRDAAAAALAEHFAQGRLTFDELNTRLDATLTATTYGELSRAARIDGPWSASE